MKSAFDSAPSFEAAFIYDGCFDFHRLIFADGFPSAYRSRVDCDWPFAAQPLSQTLLRATRYSVCFIITIFSDNDYSFPLPFLDI